jgi:retinol dehydrogenase 12
MANGASDGAPRILVTGSTDGIGLETAKQLARRGADVILHGRSRERIEKAAKALRSETTRALPEPIVMDLGSLADVRRAALELRARPDAPTVLINNAGIFMRKRELTPDGFERTMGVNSIAPVLLTQLLLDDPSSPVRRIVNVSSMAHTNGSVDPADVGLVKRKFDPYQHYGASKLANILFTTVLAGEVAARGITVNALHPGVVSTKLLTEGFGFQGSDSLADSAATSVMLALDPIGAESNGLYFMHRKRTEPSPKARDARLAESWVSRAREAAGLR